MPENETTPLLDLNNLIDKLNLQQEQKPRPENVHALNALATARQWLEVPEEAEETAPAAEPAPGDPSSASVPSADAPASTTPNEDQQEAESNQE